MNPIAAIAAAVLPFFLTPRGPTQDQVNAALAAQQAAEMQKWIVGGVIAAGAVTLYLVASRR